MFRNSIHPEVRHEPSWNRTIPTFGPTDCRHPINVVTRMATDRNEVAFDNMQLMESTQQSVHHVGLLMFQELLYQF